MKQLSCASGDVETSARPVPSRRKTSAKPRTLGDCDVGRVVTLRVVVTGQGDRAMFCRAIDSDGRESEPCHLPADWACHE